MKKNIYYDILLQQFFFTCIKSIPFSKNSNIISCFLVTNTEKTKFKSGILYFITSENLQNINDMPEGISLCVYNNSYPIPPQIIKNCSFVAETHDFKMFDEAIERCIEISNISYEMDDFIFDLSKAISEGSSLQNVVNRIATFYEHPVSIIDNTYMVIAHSNNVEIHSHILEKEYDLGYISESGLDTLKKLNFINPEKKSSRHRSYQLDSNVGYKRNNYAIIYAHEIPVAVISIFDDNNIEPIKLLYLEKIAYLLSIQLQMDEFYIRNKGEHYNHLVSIIVGDLPFESTIMETRLKLAGYPLKEFKYIITAKSIDTNSNPDVKKISSIGSYLKLIFPNSIYMVLNDSIVAFFSKSTVINDNDLESYNAQLENLNIKVGISNSFINLTSAKKYLAEAKDALEIGCAFYPNNNLHIFDKLQLLSFVKRTYNENEIDMLLYPPILELIEYDKSSDAFLVETLKEYLKYPKNPQLVCKNLFIHKNTLYYRLNKIRSIINTDLENSEVITKIMITFIALDYKEYVENGDNVSLN